MDTSGDPAGPWSKPRWNYPEYPEGSVVEIRVHGVGGESPSGMTRDPHPVLVGGDELVGFYRARDPELDPLDNSDATGSKACPTRVREVLAWGGQTSGTFRHAFWVLLLPFSLFNLAGRMQPTGSAWRGRLHRAICRVLALTMTLGVVALTCGLAFDLIAVQCAAWGQACLGETTGLTLLLGPFRQFSGDVIARLGLAAMLPTAVVLGLWYAGHYQTSGLEGYGDPEADAIVAPAKPTHLADPDFWRNAWPTSRLRGLHATAAFAWIATTLALAIHVVQTDLAGRTTTLAVAIATTETALGQPPSGIATAIQAISGWSAGNAWAVLAAVEAVVVIISLVLIGLPRMATPGPAASLHRGLAGLRFLALGGLSLAIGASLLGRVRLPVAVPAELFSALLVLAGPILVWLWIKRSGLVAPARGNAPDVRIVPNGLLAAGGLLVGWGLAGAFEESLLGPTWSYIRPDLGSLEGLWPWPELGEKLIPGVFAPPYLPLLLLVGLQLVLIAALAGAAWEKYPLVRPDASQLDVGTPVFRNLTAVVVAGLSLLLITAVGAGLHAAVLDALGERIAAPEAPVFSGEQVQLALPWWHAVNALVVGFLGPLVGGGVGLLWWRSCGSRPDDGEVADHLNAFYTSAGLSPVPTDGTDERRIKAVARGWTIQRLLRDAPRMLSRILVVLGTVLVVAWLVGGVSLGFQLDLTRWLLSDQISVLTTAGIAVLAALPVLSIALVRSSLRDRNTRREIGRLWDVVTFWPRVSHPFAPPCYGEKLVPMLQERIEFLLATEPADDNPAAAKNYRVILAGHSQGSVIALAAAASLGLGTPEGEGRVPLPEKLKIYRRRLALVSYGSPIAVLYERLFRTTFVVESEENEWLYEHVLNRVRSWHHFLALTEPFAFPFWRVDVPVDEENGWPDTDAVAQGWGVTRGLAGANVEPCPACEALPDPGGGAGIDLCVCDPDRWLLPDGYRTEPMGHSTYHRHPHVDQHLQWIADSLAAPG